MFKIEQKVLQKQPDEKRAPKVSHVHQQHDNDSTKDRYYHHVHTVNCPVYVPYNDEKQKVFLPSTTEMSHKENAKALYTNENLNEWNADPYLDEGITDTETFSYGHYDGPKQVMVQAVYIGNYSKLCADIKGEMYSMIDYNPDASLEGIYDNTYKIPIFVDDGTTVNLMPTAFYEQATFLHHLPKHDATGVNIQGCLLQLKILVCDTQANTGILLSRMALEQLQTWQDYGTNTMYIKQTAIPLFATQKHEILSG